MTARREPTPIDPADIKVGDRVRHVVEGEVNYLGVERIYLDNDRVVRVDQGGWFLLDRPEHPLRDGVYQQAPSRHLMVRRGGRWHYANGDLYRMTQDDAEFARCGYQFIGPEAGSEQNGESNG